MNQRKSTETGTKSTFAIQDLLGQSLGDLFFGGQFKNKFAKLISTVVEEGISAFIGGIIDSIMGLTKSFSGYLTGFIDSLFGVNTAAQTSAPATPAAPTNSSPSTNQTPSVQSKKDTATETSSTENTGGLFSGLMGQMFGGLMSFTSGLFSSAGEQYGPSSQTRSPSLSEIPTHTVQTPQKSSQSSAQSTATAVSSVNAAVDSEEYSTPRRLEMMD